MFEHCNGLRQGSPLLPFLFNFNVDDVIVKISTFGVGYKYRRIRADIFALAGYMVLLILSWVAM